MLRANERPNGPVDLVTSDRRLKFKAADDEMKKQYWKSVVEPLSQLHSWMEEQKNHMKDIIREASGKAVAKTPKRGNQFLRMAVQFDTLRKECVDDVHFTNDAEAAAAPRATHTPARLTPAAVKKVKDEPLSSVRSGRPLTPTSSARLGRPLAGRQPVVAHGPAPSTPVTRAPRLELHQSNSPDMFEMPKAASPAFRVLRSTARANESPYAGAVRAVVEKQNAIRKALSPARPATRSQTRHVDQTEEAAPLATAPVTRAAANRMKSKKSEVIRKLEAKAKIVMSNKEEIVREKAERAKRDREERALRVQANNRKKEAEANARLEAVKRREREIEAFRRQQATPKPLRSRATTRSPSRTRGAVQSPGRILSPQRKAPAPKNLAPISFDSEDDDSSRGTFIVRKSQPTVLAKWVPTEVKPEAAVRPEPEAAAVRRDVEERLEVGAAAVVHQEEHIVEHTKQQQHAVTVELQMTVDVQVVESEETHQTAQMDVDVSDAVSEAGVAEGGSGDATVDNVDAAPAKTAAEARQRGVSAEGDAEAENRKTAKEIQKEIIHKTEEKAAMSNAALMDSSHLSNKNVLNVTAQSSYEITPAKIFAPSTEDNYNVDDLSSGDETDEEDRPRKKVPAWAQPANLRRARREQRKIAAEVLDEIFGEIDSPQLERIFMKKRSQYKKRTSSAIWSSPLANPRAGHSKFLAIHKYMAS